MNISCRIANANTQCGRITNPPERNHSISDFSGYISQLPEGHYEVINGKIVKR